MRIGKKIVLATRVIFAAAFAVTVAQRNSRGWMCL